MKKGRHRRFEEARALKRLNEPNLEPCPECAAEPEDDHAAWCLVGEEAAAELLLDPITTLDPVATEEELQA